MSNTVNVNNLKTKTGRVFIVELETGCYLSDGYGDPARTLIQASAKMFDKSWKALKALDKAMQYRDFKTPKILPIDKRGEINDDNK